MEILVNGEKQVVNSPSPTILELLKLNKVESPDTVSVQRNGKFVNRSDYGTTLSENDEVDFLYFLGGGA